MADRSLAGESDDSESEGGDFSGRMGNDNDFSFGESYDSAGGAINQMQRSAKGTAPQVVNDKPYDEAIDLGGSDDGGSDISTPDTSDNEGAPKQMSIKAQSGPSAASGQASSGAKATKGTAQHSAPAAAQQQPATQGAGDEESSSESDTSSDEEGEGGSTASPSGAAAKLPVNAYNPSEFDNLSVSPEIQELFQYISRYKPHDIDLETKLMPFVPDFVPCIGEVDAFLKIPGPDGKPDGLGLTRLDEPCLCPSDPSVLDLQLRALSKRSDLEPMEVRSIEEAEKNPKEIKNWIDRVGDLHRQKPAPTVQYSRKMPDIEQLMQVWPAEFEEFLQSSSLPDLAGLDVDLNSLVKILATILDVPVYDQVTETLHVIFTLFSEFKSNQHFAQAESIAGGGLGATLGGTVPLGGTLNQTLGGTMGSTIGSNRGMPGAGPASFPDPGWNSRVPSPGHAG